MVGAIVGVAAGAEFGGGRKPEQHAQLVTVVRTGAQAGNRAGEPKGDREGHVEACQEFQK
jgi:hypothetical protein